MAVAYDASTGTGQQGTLSASSLTKSITIGSGSDRLLLVYVWGGATCSGVTHNGVAMTLHSREDTAYKSSVWYLVNPASGANNIVATFASATYAILTGASFSGVEQTPTINTYYQSGRVFDWTDFGTAITTTVDGCGVVACGYMDNGGLTAGDANSTLLASAQHNVAGSLCGILRTTTFPQATAGSIAITIDGATNSWAQLTTLAFAPASSATNVTVTPSALVATSSLPAPTVTAIRNVSISADLLTVTTSLPTPAVTISASVTPDVLTLTTSLPTPVISAGGNVAVSPLAVTATVTIQEPTITTESNVTVSPDVLTITSSVQAPTISVGMGVSVAVSPLTITASLIAPTVVGEKSVEVIPSPLTLTFSVLTPTKVGPTWSIVERGDTADWSIVERGDTG
jgi:hypothetical protein